MTKNEKKIKTLYKHKDTQRESREKKIKTRKSLPREHAGSAIWWDNGKGK